MKKLPSVLLLIFCAGLLSGEESRIDLNSYYRSPVILGAGYTSFSPLTGFDTGSPYSIIDFSAFLRYTPDSIPWIQAELTGGAGKFDSQNSLDPLTWDSSSVYGMAGIRFNRRFSKAFEMGFGVSGGISQSVYQHLSSDAAGAMYSLGQGAVYLDISPSYNMSLAITPTIRYQYSLDPVFKDMNGLLLGLGGTIAFRFGKDPDSADAVLKRIRFKDLQMDPIFAAMQSYYRENPLGSVTIENTGKIPLKELNVSFYQPAYMDAPTMVGVLETLEPGDSAVIPLTAVFNKEIFLTEGITPLSGEIKVAYRSGNRSDEQSFPVSYDLYDKTSIIWNDDRKVAAFVTPADSALQNYSSFIRKSCKEELVPGFNDKLQGAIEIYHALKEIGVIYQVDPRQPFASVTDTEKMAVDSISLPRTTLNKLTGDCDDLTVLYLSLLEIIGIETAYITIPGHIYTAFNTDQDSRSYDKIHPDRTKTISMDGKLWIPLEITMLGKGSFMEAWNKGAEEWNALKNNPEKRQIYITGEARETFRSIGLTERDLGLQYGNSGSISASFADEMKTLTDLVVAPYYKRVEEKATKQNYNRLGIALAEFKRQREAETAFRNAMKLDRNYLSPRVNLSNLKYQNKDYDTAAAELNQVASILEESGKGMTNAALVTYLNLFRIYTTMNNSGKAEECYKVALNISPAKAEEYAVKVNIPLDPGSTRAAEVIQTPLIFLDEEE